MRVEHWLYTIPRRLRSLLRRSQMERELEEELQLHLEQKTEQGIAMGKRPDQARYEALRVVPQGNKGLVLRHVRNQEQAARVG